MIEEQEPWMKEARCRGVDPEVFFPDSGLGVIRAQKICATCPVANRCLDFALETHQEHGVWGGRSERERRRLRKMRRRAALAS